MALFNIPKDGETFTHNVIDRCRDLITYQIWGGIEIVNFNSWLKNFKGEIELYFAACILDSLIYKSKAQTISMGKELFIKKIPTFLNTKGYDFYDYNDFINYLNSKQTEIKIVSVSKPNDPPGKSSDFLLRLYRRKLKINENCFINPTQIDSKLLQNVKVFIFVDDILATGNQFSNMIYTIKNHLKDTLNIYSPLAAHYDGILKLNLEHSNLHILPCEILDYDSNLFKSGFNDSVNSEESAKEFYKKLLISNRISINSENTFGYGNLALTYAFDLSIPDNCIQLLWTTQNDWKPLILR